MPTMSEDEYLEHIGIKRKSGRYPWGSGGSIEKRSRDFKSYIDDLRTQGMTDKMVADHIDSLVKLKDPRAKFTTSDLRAGIASSTEAIYNENASMASRLKEKGMSTSAIAERMLGDKKKESTVRGWLKNYDAVKEGSLKATADTLKAQLETKHFLDVGKGEHLYLGISFTKLNTALAMLRDEGYEVHAIQVPQLGTDKFTRLKVLAHPGTTWSQARQAVLDGKLRIIGAQSDDGGLTFRSPKEQPVSLSSKRIEVRYGPDGGSKMDGVIELRRGVPDLNLGESRYGQVRIAVDGTHYLKGMAMYADDMPPGVDIRFNTNKTSTGNKLDAMKPMKTDKDGNVDPDNPFGATTHPTSYVDRSGKTRTSALNIVGSKGAGNVEGRWDAWSRSLSSQMLSKQPLTLASTQLGKARTKQQESLNEIMRLTNPVVKKKLLEEYADSADAAAVHLKAAAMERQSTHVILPMNSMRPGEIFAPNFENGEKVVLVRHPHGGPFEIPELTVNNLNRTAQKILGGAKDAVGIHHTVAEQLSGADFDGDTVLVIPNDARKVKTAPQLAGLKDFNPQAIYKIPDGDTTTPRMTKKNTQTEMGKISNLITDMTIHKANADEMARAIRHSMVVIDAEKHGLNYKQSEQDNNISQLKSLYQGKANAGASTLISRASSTDRIPQVRQPSGKAGINPLTGEKILVPTGRSFVNKNGEVVVNTTKGTKMEFAKDARTLMSGPKDPKTGLPMGTPMEQVYASHANTMKALANEARKESVAIAMPATSAAAKAVYAKEIASLDQKLKIAQRNAPLERRAQVIGNAMARARKDANPGLDKDDYKKIDYQSLEEARAITAANKTRVVIEDREWQAIQSGAIAHSKLSEILSNADMDRVKELATPRARTSLTPGQMNRARAMATSGRSMTEIARELGIPRSTLSENLAK